MPVYTVKRLPPLSFLRSLIPPALPIFSHGATERARHLTSELSPSLKAFLLSKTKPTVLSLPVLGKIKLGSVTERAVRLGYSECRKPRLTPRRGGLTWSVTLGGDTDYPTPGGLQESSPSTQIAEERLSSLHESIALFCSMREIAFFLSFCFQSRRRR